MQIDEPIARGETRSGSESADWDALPVFDRERFEGLAMRLVEQLQRLRGLTLGRDVDRLEHCLQSASRAARANRPDPYVACALLHDVGDVLCPADHASIAAAIVAPFVDDGLLWMTKHHVLFQAKHSSERTGLASDASDRFSGSPWFDLTAEFCSRYDWPAFDAGYVSMPLEEFEPLLAAVFHRPRWVDLQPMA